MRCVQYRALMVVGEEICVRVAYKRRVMSVCPPTLSTVKLAIRGATGFTYCLRTAALLSRARGQTRVQDRVRAPLSPSVVVMALFQVLSLGAHCPSLCAGQIIVSADQQLNWVSSIYCISCRKTTYL